MTIFEMVKYHSKEYPADIPLRIEECSAHMDITEIKASLKRSMHTEYSYGKRNFESDLIREFPALCDAHKNNVPQLWYDVKWGSQFASFIIKLSADEIPAVIEIHPPFTDYTDMNGFIESYKAFEEIIKENFSHTEIMIENRCGSVYHGGKFLISKLDDLEKLCENIEAQNLNLKIAYDVPQIYTAHNVKIQSMYIQLLQNTKNIRSFIGGVHLWGKQKSKTGRLVSHCGDLNSYFFENTELKNLFLNEFSDCFGDGICRKMVLEVNGSNDDLKSIINDLVSVGIKFV